MTVWYPLFDFNLDKNNYDDIKESVKDLYAFSCPLIEMALSRKKELSQTDVNEFHHSRALFSHGERVVTTPNNDTLYSMAWLDLRNGPIIITTPDTGDRYFSLAFLDMYTNNIVYMGTSQTDGKSETRKFIAPDSDEVETQGVTRASTPWLWVLGRTLVNGEEDLPQAHAVQDNIQIDAPAPAGPPVMPPESPDKPLEWLETIWKLIEENPPSKQDEVFIDNFRRMGLDRASNSQDERMLQAISEGIREAHDHLASTKLPNGKASRWVFPKPYIGNFGQHFHYRARVSMSGLGALTIDEAIYARFMEGQDNLVLDGTHLWRLHFPADQLPPVKSFWSISLYEPDGEGRYFFTKNKLNRHSIGDRTQGLIWNDDGSLDIWISHDEPGENRLNNWLPAPNGHFAIFLRGYFPEQSFINGEYYPPLPERVD
ncbi:DUF1254 domain-containing protein [Marinobacter salexigens]|uniref:DUF1254 domain-containing protein n=1 Tax=Marinobacter salexigens TaxID=1925763 RepID=A0ABS6ABV2_9GAMM|nr:DUF1254 domain-containing protein [Marinobacter salexigens]MBU2874672.1 DUF1254 domain-containing protein [Marinobacter salexigens]